MELGAFDPNKDYTGKFCYMFRFEQDFGIPFFHCTHKYLGEVDLEVLWRCNGLVDEHFAALRGDLSMRQLWWFDKFSYFGPEKDTPVLERRNQGGMLLDLKAKLDAVVPDKWPSYRPHVTIPHEFEFVRLPLVPKWYQVCEGGKVIREWAIGRGHR